VSNIARNALAMPLPFESALAAATSAATAATIGARGTGNGGSGVGADSLAAVGREDWREGGREGGREAEDGREKMVRVDREEER